MNRCENGWLMQWKWRQTMQLRQRTFAKWRLGSSSVTHEPRLVERTRAFDHLRALATLREVPPQSPTLSALTTRYSPLPPKKVAFFARCSFQPRAPQFRVARV